MNRSEVITAARKYLGVPYTNYHGRIFIDEQGKISGKLSCLSFVLYVARDVGMFDAIEKPINFNLDRMGRYSDWLDLANELLEHHCERILPIESTTGDLLRMRYSDIDRRAPWHIGIRTNDNEQFWPSVIHCINHEVGGGGGVVENRMDLTDWRRVESAWRIKGIASEQL